MAEPAETILFMLRQIRAESAAMREQMLGRLDLIEKRFEGLERGYLSLTELLAERRRRVLEGRW